MQDVVGTNLHNIVHRMNSFFLLLPDETIQDAHWLPLDIRRALGTGRLYALEQEARDIPANLRFPPMSPTDQWTLVIVPSAFSCALNV